MFIAPGEAHGRKALALGTNWAALHIWCYLTDEKDGHRITSINFKFKQNDVLVIIRKDSPTGGKVAFIEADSLDQALYGLAYKATRDGFQWRTDKWHRSKS